MEKHRAYYELLDRLSAGPGCPICGHVHGAMDSYLNGYLEEGVTDEANWGALKAAQGWCGRHAHQIEAKADGLAVALFYGHLIDETLATVEMGPGKLAKLKAVLGGTSKPVPCPGCLREHEAETGQAHLLANAAGEAEAQDKMRPALQLCVPHLRLVLRYATGEGEAFIRQDQGGKLRALRAEMELFTRKTSHDGRGKEELGPEKDSWKRGLKRWYGLNWGE